MDLELPDGTVVRGIPDGLTKAQITNKLIANGYGKNLSSPADVAMADPTREMSFMDTVRAGAGRSLTNLARGAGQMIGMGPTSDQVKEQRATDAPLHATIGGKVGEFIGGAAPLAATAFIPGANTYTGSMLAGSLMGAAEPVTADESRLKNVAIGTAGGAAGKYVGDKLATALSNKTAQLATQQSQNAVKDATLAAGKDAGYVVPPSAVNPTWLGNRIESIGGKAAIGQEAAYRNQGVTNDLARKALDLPENAAITQGTLKGIRKTEGQAYENVASLNADAADALKQLRQARSDATAQFKYYERSASPEALDKAKAAAADAKLWDQFLENEAQQAGRNDLLPALKSARERIAKTWDVDKALNTSTADVSAPVLARAIDKGKYMSGDLETAARFADAFPQYAREGAKLPAAGVSKSEALAAALLGGGGFATGGPMGALAGALPLLSGPARAFVLSKAGQAMLAKPPSYAPGLALKLAGKSAPAIPAALAQALLVGNSEQ